MEIVLLLIAIACFIGAIVVGILNIKRVNEYIRIEKRNGGDSRNEQSED